MYKKIDQLKRHFDCNSKLLLALIFASAFLAGCSGGSGGDNQTNTTGGTGGTTATGFTYSGPPALNSDVTEFQVNVWANLVADNRCGNCHKQGGVGNGAFVRDDDINMAYNIVTNSSNPLVDLTNPGNSLMVQRVGAGHNCWLASDVDCAQILTSWINDWATTAGSVTNTINLTAPQFNPVADSRNFPSGTAAFAGIYDILVNDARGNCDRCHSEDGTQMVQQPFFASSDINTAYLAAQSKIDLGDFDRVNATPAEPTRSRFIVRLRDEFHNCWTNCAADAVTMQDAIIAFAGGITPTVVDPNLLTSGAVVLSNDGVIASSGGRVETDMIAYYTFRPPDSSSAQTLISEVFDVSGINPPANLRAFGNDVRWVGSWGADITNGRLQGSASKLYDLINLTGEYSIEGWVVPANVVQDNTARIVTYSGGAVSGNNFAMGQSTYNYDFLARSSVTDDDGAPAYSTPDADEVLQATLQHVVMTYDPVNGRRIFVNAQEVGDGVDPQGGGNLSDWDPSFALSLGQDAGGGSQWQGTIRMLAIHNRVMPQADIQNNFDIGVGEKFFLLFDLTTAGLVNMPQAYVVFEVEQFDSYGYLFKNPFFISLDSAAMPGSIPLRGMRIGINGKESIQGQAYAKIDTVITDATYTNAGQLLSDFGTIIPLENGPDNDQFFLTFDEIGTSTFNRPAEPAAATLTPELTTEEQSLIGVRHFDEINEALHQMTGVPKDDAQVVATFGNVRQQLPQDENITGFLPAHQMGVTQLAVTYCSRLANNNAGNRATYFPGFDFGAANTVFGAAGSTARGQIIDPLLNALVAHTIAPSGSYGAAAHLTTHPAPGDQAPATVDNPQDVVDELNDLIDILVGNGSTTPEIVTAVCSAAMGSSLMLMQ
ncbi:LamG domain-containing protein [Aurantivibrio infirmus]